MKWSSAPLEKHQGCKIESTDREIDELVYELSPTGMIYGLSEEEIRIVEGIEP